MCCWIFWQWSAKIFSSVKKRQDFWPLVWYGLVGDFLSGRYKDFLGVFGYTPED